MTRPRYSPLPRRAPWLALLAAAACSRHAPAPDVRESRRPSIAETRAGADAADVLESVRRRFRDGDDPVISRVPPHGAPDVELPARANGATRLRDRATGMSIAFSLLDSGPAVRSERTDGVAIFERGGPEASDVFVRRTDSGVEDFLAFENQAEREALRYLVDVSAVAGLRLIDNVLEFLDTGGAPRLRMDPPRLIDAAGVPHEARVALEDCAADRDPSAPWSRAVTAPGRRTCVVRVDWSESGAAHRYPLLVDPAWTATANSMTSQRTGHTATRLTGGRVLVVGGQRPNGATTQYLSTTDFFDPATNTFAAGPSLTQARSLHVAVLLSNGSVLVAGGAGAAGPLNSTELYEPSTQKFRTVGILQAARQEASVVELTNGKVLIAGGLAATSAIPTAETFDTGTERWTFTQGNMANRRFGGFLGAIPTGQGLAVGGTSIASGTLVIGSAEYYNPASDTFTAASGLATARHHFGAGMLSASRIIVAGGSTSTAETASSEIYDSNSGAFAAAGNLAHARARLGLAVLGGSAIATGGVATQAGTKTYLKSVELYDAVTKAWVALPDMTQARADHTTTALADGRVLVAGGSTSATAVSATAELLSLDALGAACKSGATCASKQCVDGVCCESACTTKCYGCASASTGLANGICGPALAGKDSQGSCKDDGAPTCGQNGFCNGSGDCAKYPAKPCTSSACAKGDDCTSGNCVDGVCCDKPCSAACEACSAAKKGSGTSGTCGPVAAGTDPDSDCGQMGTAGCSGDATCDGAGACRVPNAGKSCAQAACSDAVTLAKAATCTAAGECTPEKTTCSPYRCDATAAACKTSCAAAADCAAGGTCVSGECHLKDDGDSCAAGSECTSNHCVDGVCCNTACTAQCAACNATGSEGKCTPVTGAPHGSRPACTGTAPCGGTCNGRLADTCTYPSGNSCGTEVGCAEGGTTERKCNGYGDCASLPATTCAPYSCAAGECKTSCETDSDCAIGYLCDSKAGCVLRGGTPLCDGGKSCTPTPPAAAGDDGGCGCRVGTATNSAGGWLVALQIMAAALTRRRPKKRKLGARTRCAPTHTTLTAWETPK